MLAGSFAHRGPGDCNSGELAMTMKIITGAIGAAALLFAGSAAAQDKIVLGMSGWTGFAPLSLAAEAGLFKKHGVDVEIKFIPQKERHLTVASGSTQAVATTVDTFVAWTSAGIPLTQVLLLDKSKGGDRSEERRVGKEWRSRWAP